MSEARRVSADDIKELAGIATELALVGSPGESQLARAVLLLIGHIGLIATDSAALLAAVGRFIDSDVWAFPTDVKHRDGTWSKMFGCIDCGAHGASVDGIEHLPTCRIAQARAAVAAVQHG